MTADQKITFLDLVTPHTELEAELVEVFRESLRNAAFIGGPAVENFEREFAAFCDAKYCVGVSSGTDALRFALAAAGVRSGDVVVTVPNTFIATTEAISQVGAHPEFVDVDELTSTMDPEKLRTYFATQCDRDSAGRVISRRSKRPVTAIVPVHLYGHMADMDPILEIAEEYGLLVIEDACQAHGTQYFSSRENRWRTAGSMGKAAAFSFYPGKNLGACGEAGAAVTNDQEIARQMSMLRDHGQSRKYYHDIEGYNGRLDAIQAGILRVKLRHLKQWNQQRRKNAELYNTLLAGSSDALALPQQAPWSKSIYHLYVVRTDSREELTAALAKHNIGTGIHYPIPLHLQTAYKGLGYKTGDFPVSEQLAREILSLPMYPNLKPEQIEKVVQVIEEFLAAKNPSRGTQPILAAR